MVGRATNLIRILPDFALIVRPIVYKFTLLLYYVLKLARNAMKSAVAAAR